MVQFGIQFIKSEDTGSKWVLPLVTYEYLWSCAVIDYPCLTAHIGGLIISSSPFQIHWMENCVLYLMPHQNQRTTSMNSNLFTQILAEEPHSSLLILCGCPVVWSGRVCCMWAYVSTSNSEEIIYLGFVSLSGKTMTLFSFLLWNTYLGKTGFCEPVIYWKYYSASIFYWSLIC